MNQNRPQHVKEKAAVRKDIYFKGGRLYFSRKAERSFYFMLTMLVLILGLLDYLGLIN